MPEIIVREQARAAGLKWYSSGQTCFRGHDEWYAVSNRCRVCARLRQIKYVTEKPHLNQASQRKYAEKNKERRRAISLEWGRNHPERVRAWARRYYEKNAEKIRANGRKKTLALEVLKREGIDIKL